MLAPRSRKRCLMIGAGGMADEWIRRILPQFADRLQIVGLVDVSEAALAASGEFVQLDDACRFTNKRSAFKAVEADFCIVVTVTPRPCWR